MFAITLLMAACEQTEIPPTTSPSDDDVTYSFDTEIISNTGGNEDGIFSALNESYPDSTFTVSVRMRGSAAATAIIKITAEVEGNFDYAFVYDWFGTSYTDTIYGTGYFDADTAYMHYTYQPMDDDGNLYSEPKEVEIHSL